MSEIGEKYLPIGTVVILKGGKKRIMIIGYCAPGDGEHTGKTYDYSGCLFPEGMMFSPAIAVFDHEQIDKVFHKGLDDEEYQDFNVKVTQLANAMSLVQPTTKESILNQKEEVKPENPTE